MLPIDALTTAQGLVRILQAVPSLQQLSQLQQQIDISKCTDQGVYKSTFRLVYTSANIGNKVLRTSLTCSMWCAVTAQHPSDIPTQTAVIIRRCVPCAAGAETKPLQSTLADDVGMLRRSLRQLDRILCCKLNFPH